MSIGDIQENNACAWALSSGRARLAPAAALLAFRARLPDGAQARRAKSQFREFTKGGLVKGV